MMTQELIDELSCGQAVAWKDFGETFAYVMPMMFGNYRIIHADVWAPVGGWCYDTMMLAVKGLEEWDGEGRPRWWKKDVTTGERMTVEAWLDVKSGSTTTQATRVPA